MIIFISVLNFIDFILIDSEILEELRSNTTLSLLHDVLVTELQFDLFYALDVRVCDFTVLITFTFLNFVRPLYSIELEEKVKNKEGVSHIYKGEANTALCFQVLWEVKVIILALKIDIYKRHHIYLVELDWNVPNHEGCLSQHLLVIIHVCIYNSVKIYLVIFGTNQYLFLGILQFLISSMRCWTLQQGINLLLEAWRLLILLNRAHWTLYLTTLRLGLFFQLIGSTLRHLQRTDLSLQLRLHHQLLLLLHLLLPYQLLLHLSLI